MDWYQGGDDEAALVWDAAAVAEDRSHCTPGHGPLGGSVGAHRCVSGLHTYVAFAFRKRRRPLQWSKMRERSDDGPRRLGRNRSEPSIEGAATAREKKPCLPSVAKLTNMPRTGPGARTSPRLSMASRQFLQTRQHTARRRGGTRRRTSWSNSSGRSIEAARDLANEPHT